jgi:hypothetical protein
MVAAEAESESQVTNRGGYADQKDLRPVRLRHLASQKWKNRE